MEVYLFKLNGWSDHFGERIAALSQSVDSITIFRSRPEADDGIADADGVSVVELYPSRGTFVKPGWAKPIVFSLHVIQAIIFALWTMCRRGRRPDVVHALDYILGGLAARVTTFLARVPLVVSVRGLKEPAYKNMVEESGTLRSKINYRILIMLSHIVLSGSDHIITKAPYQCQFVKDNYRVNCGFTTVPTGVDFEKFDADRVKSTEPFFQLFPDANVDWQDSTVLLFLGKFIPRKGFDTYITYVELLDSELDEDIVFTAVGGYRDAAFRDRLEERIQRLEGRLLVYPERVDFPKVPALLSAANGVVLLSEPKNEGVPRSLQEAYAIETPIITADVVGIREAFVDLPGCRLVDRDAPNEFKEAVEELASGTVKTDRERAKEEFDIYTNYSKYVAVYESVIGCAGTQTS
ncbi:glycosyltransferase [Halobacteriales archaeon Cl-PHB]